MKGLTLLLIEDNPGDARLFQEMLNELRGEYQITWVQTLTDAKKEIAQKKCHLVLCDLGLPDSQGLETAYAVIAADLDMPIIILTGQDDEQLALEAIKAGVQDYLVKNSISPELLRRTIRYAIERKRAKEELIKLSQAMEQSPVSVEITDPQGNIEYVNPKFTQVTGYTLEEVKGKNPRILKSGETSPEEYRRLWESILSGRVWQGEFKNRRKDGSFFWERAFISAIRNATGDITHFLAIKEDITTEKSLEMQLLQAQRLESVGRLAGGVAHDFNNMLNVILGFTEMAAMNLPEDHPAMPSLEEVKSAALRSVEIVRQLLAFARKQTIRPVVLNLNKTVPGMLKMLHRLIGEDIDLAWRPGDDLWRVKIDPSQVDQLLANLTVNARDAIEGVGKVTIETGNALFDASYCDSHAGFIPGKYVMLAVSDNGCGMDPQILASIFEPFFTTKASGMGTGLGLATVYGIVKQNSGFINVYSEPGSGTTFKIYLPGTIEASETEILKNDPVICHGTETVLFVEDEQSILGLGQKILEGYGYTVISASSPRDALDLAKAYQGPIHLLITDVVLPEMNGKALKNNLMALRPDMRVLYMSGYTVNVIAHHGVLEKGIHFLQKPFSVKSLAAKVREVLDHVPGEKRP